MVSELIIAGVLGGLYLFERITGRAERQKLLNRLMAKNYEEFEYYDKRFGTDIAELKKMRNDERKERKKQSKDFEEISIDAPKDPELEEMIKNLEEDWGDEELDLTKKQDK